MKSITTKKTALIACRPLCLQIMLPLGSPTKPQLDEGARDEVLVALARLLLEAAGLESGTEVGDDTA